jgi:hypothetical protein
METHKTKETRRTREQSSRRFSRIILISILVLVIGLPLGLLQFQSSKTGKTWSQIIEKLLTRRSEEISAVDAPHGKKIDFLSPRPIGDTFTKPPMISNLQTVDLDKDGLLDVVVCDALNNRVSWIRQFPAGVFTEHALGDVILAPSYVQAVDFDKDGDLDLVVSSLGMIFPSNDKIGSIIILENDGTMNFKNHVVVEKIARASAVTAGDLDGDGDMDLAAVQFGYDDGETRWLENLGGWQFKSHILQSLSGGINCELIDIDSDGDLDIVTLISQEWEEVYLFVNNGKGQFEPKLLYGSTNEDFGSSNISLVDLDRDGDIDILYTNGDAFDYIPPRPRPWHGINWLENKGNYKFEFHRIANFGGAYGARGLDVDGDGDLDIFAVSAFNLWEKPTAQSFIWLENDGKMHFTSHDIANNPTHILCLSLGDFNNDGQVDMVTGGMHAYPPYDRMARVMLWMNNWRGAVR